MVANSLDLFPSGGDPSPIQVHECGISVVVVEAVTHLELSPIIQSPFFFGDLTLHSTADGTLPRRQPHPASEVGTPGKFSARRSGAAHPAQEGGDPAQNSAPSSCEATFHQSRT